MTNNKNNKTDDTSLKGTIDAGTSMDINPPLSAIGESILKLIGLLDIEQPYLL